MSANPPTPELPVAPGAVTTEMAARAWHAYSDEAVEGIAFDSARCTCRNYGWQAKHVVDLFTGTPTPEPEGLGAVVVNPLTGEVWVRAGHPTLPWYESATADQQWTSPTTGDWFTWEGLPRPLVVQSTGWRVPPSPKPRPPDAHEPNGIGAVVTDATGRTWIRVEAGGDPWLDPASLAEGVGNEATWENLVHPVTVRSLGWERP